METLTHQIHAHQVLDILDQQKGPVSLQDLQQQVNQAYGAGAVYTNCNNDQFTFEQLMQFMQARQKITLTNGQVTLNKGNRCSH
jgi:probable metal-binding protein